MDALPASHKLQNPEAAVDDENYIMMECLALLLSNSLCVNISHHGNFE